MWQVRLERIGLANLLENYDLENDAWFTIVQDAERALSHCASRDPMASKFLEDLRNFKQVILAS